MPAGKLHEDTWKGCNRNFDKKRITARKEKTKTDQTKFSLTHEKKHGARVSRENKKLMKLAMMGIDYEFDGLVAQEKKTQQVKKANAARMLLEKAAAKEKEQEAEQKKEKAKEAKVDYCKILGMKTILFGFPLKNQCFLQNNCCIKQCKIFFPIFESYSTLFNRFEFIMQDAQNTICNLIPCQFHHQFFIYFLIVFDRSKRKSKRLRS